MRDHPPRPPASWLLTPLIGFAATLLAVVAIYYGEAWLVPAMGGGCAGRPPDCALGIGVQLIGYAFVALCASAIAGPVVAVRHKRDPRPRSAVRRGLWVALGCAAGYAALSVVAWW
ncbi:hypothetical protein [Gandjariella thermophila]|uniref:Vitamin K epoxide reductase domain-containing protein n=1 Tax=Gandjariella thermophila TaxID=1931992 RepID=A0A4D4JAK7_9PSEU|nr:hypothetical protein [Gandjariella thermophila]GDY32362.1 hypothetical protein GTS_39950 [Gandjariella thermophila]